MILKIEMDKADARIALSGISEGFGDGTTAWDTEDTELEWELLEQLRKAVDES